MSNDLTPFLQLNIADFLLRALDDMGFTKPTPVQEKAIPLLLEGRDVIAQAQTGTGKTAAFAIPILHRLPLNSTPSPAPLPTQGPHALILSPTRELAIQIAEQITSLSRHLPNITIAVLCGGQDYRPQLKQLKQGAHIVVGTPGRVLDHMSRNSLKLDHLSTFVLDEADEMLRMGFIEDVETILEKLPDNKQMALFSATMPSRIRDIAQTYLKDPVSVTIKSETATAPDITQRFLFASPSQKPSALLRVLAAEHSQRIIIFVRTKIACEEISTLLQGNGHRAVALHGDLQQKSREKILEQFRQGIVDILVATDVAARGLDVEGVSHVINYDIPQSCETYVHRIGRTGRAGNAGVSILFVTPKEGFLLGRIERHTRQRIEKIQPPSDQLIQDMQLKRFANSITQRLSHPELPTYQKIINQFLKEHETVSPQDLAAVLALMSQSDRPWNTTLPRMDTHDGHFSENSHQKRPSRQNERRDFDRKPRFENNDSKYRPKPREHQIQAMTCYRIDVGKNHGARPNNLVGAIANEGGLSSRNISGLEIHADFSTVYLPQDMPKKAVQDLAKAWVCGRQLKLSEVRA